MQLSIFSIVPVLMSLSSVKSIFYFTYSCYGLFPPPVCWDIPSIHHKFSSTLENWLLENSSVSLIGFSNIVPAFALVSLKFVSGGKFAPGKEVTKSCVQSVSHIQLFATLWNVAHQAPLSIGFPRQEYWRRLPFPSPGDRPKLHLLHLLHRQVDSLPVELPGKPWNSIPIHTIKSSGRVNWKII